MKVYFDATPSGIELYGENYKKIAEEIVSLGHELTSDFIINFSEDFYKLPKLEWSEHYKKIMNAVSDADVLVVEMTKSSLGLGMCVQQGFMQGKPVIALHTKDRVDLFIGGAEDVESKLLVVEYDVDNLKQVVKNSLEYVSDWLDCRFTLIINNQIRKHLDDVVKTGTNRSEYIRDLITKDMEKK